VSTRSRAGTWEYEVLKGGKIEGALAPNALQHRMVTMKPRRLISGGFADIDRRAALTTTILECQMR
jgi:hypothetical protein